LSNYSSEVYSGGSLKTQTAAKMRPSRNGYVRCCLTEGSEENLAVV
jgi:hypothetical protein